MSWAELSNGMVDYLDHGERTQVVLHDNRHVAWVMPRHDGGYAIEFNDESWTSVAGTREEVRAKVSDYLEYWLELPPRFCRGAA